MWLDNQEEDKSKQQSQTNTPTVGAGGGAAPAGGGISAPSSQGNFSTMSPVQTPEATQKWATAQDYLKANQPQANQLGQKVQSGLESTLGQQKSTIDTAAQSAQEAVKSGTTAFDTDLAKTATETPEAITKEPAKLQDFLNQWNASYKGPESFETTESYTPAVEATTKAKEIAGNLSAPGGREQILQDQFNVYGAGNKAIDRSLLQTAENYGELQKLAPQFTSLQDYLGGKSQEIGNAVSQGKAITQQTKESIRGMLPEAIEKFKSSIANKELTAEEGATQKADLIKNAIAANSPLGENELATLGITEAQYNDLQQAADKLAQAEARLANLQSGTSGVLETPRNMSVTKNIDPYVSYSNPLADITQGNISSAEDYARAKAFADLTGSTSFLGDTNDQAGTADTNPVTFDYQRAIQDYLDKAGRTSQEADQLQMNQALKPGVGVADTMTNTTGPNINTGIDMIKDAVSPGNLVDTGKGFIEDRADAITKPTEDLADIVQKPSDLISHPADTAQNLVNDMGNAVDPTGGLISTPITAPTNLAIDTAQAVGNAMTDYLKNPAGNIISPVTNVTTNLVGKVDDILSGISSSTGSIASSAAGKLGDALGIGGKSERSPEWKLGTRFHEIKDKLPAWKEGQPKAVVINDTQVKNSASVAIWNGSKWVTAMDPNRQAYALSPQATPEQIQKSIDLAVSKNKTK